MSMTIFIPANFFVRILWLLLTKNLYKGFHLILYCNECEKGMESSLFFIFISSKKKKNLRDSMMIKPAVFWNFCSRKKSLRNVQEKSLRFQEKYTDAADHDTLTLHIVTWYNYKHHLRWNLVQNRLTIMPTILIKQVHIRCLTK